MFRALYSVLIMAGTFGICCSGMYGQNSGHDGAHVQPILEQKERKLRATGLMLASGGIAVGAAIALYFYDRKRPPDSTDQT